MQLTSCWILVLVMVMLGISEVKMDTIYSTGCPRTVLVSTSYSDSSAASTLIKLHTKLPAETLVLVDTDVISHFPLSSLLCLPYRDAVHQRLAETTCTFTVFLVGHFYFSVSIPLIQILSNYSLFDTILLSFTSIFLDLHS